VATRFPNVELIGFSRVLLTSSALPRAIPGPAFAYPSIGPGYTRSAYPVSARAPRFQTLAALLQCIAVTATLPQLRRPPGLHLDVEVQHAPEVGSAPRLHASSRNPSTTWLAVRTYVMCVCVCVCAGGRARALCPHSVASQLVLPHWLACCRSAAVGVVAAAGRAMPRGLTGSAKPCRLP
jgi:hypothetical protein